MLSIVFVVDEVLLFTKCMLSIVVFRICFYFTKCILSNAFFVYSIVFFVYFWDAILVQRRALIRSAPQGPTRIAQSAVDRKYLRWLLRRLQTHCRYQALLFEISSLQTRPIFIESYSRCFLFCAGSAVSEVACF